MEKRTITRRRFVKTTGGATLGTVLGLGLLPSVTRRLGATDISDFGARNGVKYADAGYDPATQKFPGIGMPGYPAAAAEPVDDNHFYASRIYQQDFTNVLNVGGLAFTVTTKLCTWVNHAPGLCQASLDVVQKSIVTASVVKDGTTYTATVWKRRQTHYTCPTGTAVHEDHYDSQSSEPDHVVVFKDATGENVLEFNSTTKPGLFVDPSSSRSTHQADSKIKNLDNQNNESAGDASGAQGSMSVSVSCCIYYYTIPDFVA